MSDTMHSPMKLVVSGPVGAGKTTFIRCLSETEVIDTEEMSTEDIGKKTTTVAMDFGSLVIDGYPVHLFGTPGQERFNYMWDVLCQGAHGLMFLVAGDRPQDFSHGRSILEYITSQIAIPFIIGVTRQDKERVWSPSDVAAYFEVPEHLVVGFNATNYNDSLDTLYDLFGIINTHYEEQAEQDAII